MPDVTLVINTITPANLDKRFTSDSTYHEMSSIKAKAKVNGEEWKAEWDHPQIIQEPSDSPPKVSIDILPYEFDREDANTTEHLRHLNGNSITSDMKQHVLSVKKQEFSRKHPKFGPFKIQCLNVIADKFAIFNRKGDRAYTFQGKDYCLDTTGMDFDLDDPDTYTLVCRLGAHILWDDLLTLQTRDCSDVSKQKGPYRIVFPLHNTSSLTFHSKSGATWTSSLSGSLPTSQEW